MKKFNNIILTLILCAVIALLIAFSPAARKGAIDGFEMCENIIIPSLLPILIICNLIIKSRASLVFQWIFGGIVEKILKLPKCSAAAIILGLFGGYPTGAVLTAELYENGIIDEECAQRIMRFNFCGGAAFIITAVGTVCYSSTKIGVILFIVNIISALISAILFSLFTKRKNYYYHNKKQGASISDTLPQSVEKTVKNLAVMSAYIILFSALNGIINPPEHILPLLEITDGICGSENLLPLPYCAFFLSFGGICIHLQLFSYLKQMHIKYIDFLAGRMFSALISFATTKAYLYCFPEEAAVFSNISSPVHSFTQGGIALSSIMIIGCAVIIFDIENRKSKLI